MNIIYVTCKNNTEATKISKIILKEKLAACINIIPSQSIYFWNNKLKKSRESILLIKTNKNKIKKIEELVRKNHSYKIPCILTFSVKSSKKFLNWVNSELK